jgi:RimJ/RimL family protein N-acetyltransferase
MNVSLRAVDPQDLEVFFEDQRDPDAVAMAAFSSRERDDFMTHWREILSRETNVTRAVVADGSVAGNVVSWTHDGLREVGYWIGRSHWGKGIATEALRLFVAEVVERPLYAWVARHNTGSIRVLEKVGFSLIRADGDHLVYRLDRATP